MPTIKTQTIEWKPFSKKHKDYIKNALKNKMNVAEGAIRSGKTIDHCIIAAMYLENCPDKIHLATGSTLGNAKLNIGVCNGYGLENQLRDRQNIRRAKYDPETLGEDAKQQVNEEKMLEAGDISLDDLRAPLKPATKEIKPSKKVMGATDNVSRIKSAVEASDDVTLVV